LGEWIVGQTLVIRADADPVTGTGHVMRCVALAQAWNRLGGSVIFHTAPLAPMLEEILRRSGCRVSKALHFAGDSADASGLITKARDAKAVWVVQDGYHLHSDYQSRIKEAGLRLLVIDDFADEPSYSADIVLNQNVYARAQNYQALGKDSRLLPGLDHVLLRQDFWTWQGKKKRVDEMRRALITFGGSDPRNMTGTALQAMADIESDFELKVVVGPSNPRLDELRTQVREGNLEAEVLSNVQSMSEMLDWADLAVSAAGSTAYEFAFMGVPALLVQVADNQRRGAPLLAERGMAVDLGWHEDLTPQRMAASIREMMADKDRRTKMARLGQAAVDGKGVARALTCMKEMSVG